MDRGDVDRLDPSRPHWAVAVEAPMRNWVAAPGCRAHARFLVDGDSFRPSLTRFERFDSRAECLSWIMVHRRALTEQMPGATLHPVKLANWLLGLP